MEEDGRGTGLGRLLEFFRSGDGETFTEEGGPDLVRFLESKLPVGGVPGFGIELPFTSREPGEVPNELDLSIDELLVSFNGLGPLDGGGSITPNSEVLGMLLSDGLALNVRGPGVDGMVG